MTKKDKEISTTELAGMVADGFLRIDQRFESIDQRFESIDKRFDEHGKRFDYLEREIKLTRDEIKLTRTEMSVGFSEIKDEIKWLDQRIDNLLKMTNEDMSSIIDELNGLKLRVKKLELKNN